VKVARFTDAFAASSNRLKAICDEIGIKVPEAAAP
jgi:propane 2-monooxygenase small subunit